MNALPRNSLPQLYIIIVDLGYLYIHTLSIRFSIVASWFSLYCTISNHQVLGYIIVKVFSIRVSSWPYPPILYGPIRSTDNMSQGTDSAIFLVFQYNPFLYAVDTYGTSLLHNFGELLAEQFFTSTDYLCDFSASKTRFSMIFFAF